MKYINHINFVLAAIGFACVIYVLSQTYWKLGEAQTTALTIPEADLSQIDPVPAGRATEASKPATSPRLGPPRNTRPNIQKEPQARPRTSPSVGAETRSQPPRPDLPNIGGVKRNTLPRGSTSPQLFGARPSSTTPRRGTSAPRRPPAITSAPTSRPVLPPQAPDARKREGGRATPRPPVRSSVPEQRPPG